MPNRKKEIIDLINQQIIDLTIQQYQQQTPVSNKGRKSTREAGKKQSSNKSKKQVIFNENLQEIRYFYKNDPSPVSYTHLTLPTIYSV